MDTDKLWLIAAHWMIAYVGVISLYGYSTFQDYLITLGVTAVLLATAHMSFEYVPNTRKIRALLFWFVVTGIIALAWHFIAPNISYEPNQAIFGYAGLLAFAAPISCIAYELSEDRRVRKISARSEAHKAYRETLLRDPKK